MPETESVEPRGERGAGGEIGRLIGIYDAVGTVRGEVAYFLRARLGGSHCGLCDITHGAVRERSEWREWRNTLPVPFDTFHLDDQPSAVRSLGLEAPVVVAEVGDQLVVLLDRTALDRCGGSVEDFAEVLRDAASHRGLRWPPRPMTIQR